MSKKKTITREMEYLVFPVTDIIDVLMQSFTRLTAKAAAKLQNDPTGKLTIEDIADPDWIDYQLTLPIPISQELLTEIEIIEDEMLRHGCAQDCEECRSNRTTEAGTKCHGVFKKGDLIKCMMAGILKVGFQGFLEKTLSNALANLLSVKETTAAETFNPELRKVLH